MFVINAAQTEDVLFGPHGCLAKLNKGAVVLCCATVAPEAARGLGKRITEAGFLMLDAPVSGGKAGAQGGTMTVMASGCDAAFAKAQPVLDAISTKVWKLGSEPGVGSTVKMVNQLLAGVHIATAAEALSLGIRAGADPQALYDVISTSAGSSWMWQNRVPHILEGDDAPLSAVNIFVKDLGIVLDQARSLTFPLPLASAAHQLFLAAAAHGEGMKDDSFVIRFWQALTGIELPKKQGPGGQPARPPARHPVPRGARVPRPIVMAGPRAGHPPRNDRVAPTGNGQARSLRPTAPAAKRKPRPNRTPGCSLRAEMLYPAPHDPHQAPRRAVRHLPGRPAPSHASASPPSSCWRTPAARWRCRAPRPAAASPPTTRATAPPRARWPAASWMRSAATTTWWCRPARAVAC